MVTVRVLRPFRDLKAHVNREAGDTFEATGERAAYIDAALPGYVEVMAAAADRAAAADLSGMTVSQLRALASERGVALPKGARKADIIEALKE